MTVQTGSIQRSFPYGASPTQATCNIFISSIHDYGMTMTNGSNTGEWSQNLLETLRRFANKHWEFPHNYSNIKSVIYSNLPAELTSSGTYLSLSHRRYTLEWQSSNSQTQSYVSWSRVTVQMDGRACYQIGLEFVTTMAMPTERRTARPDPLLCPTRIILISRSNNLLTTQVPGSRRLLISCGPIRVPITSFPVIQTDQGNRQPFSPGA